MNRTGIIFRHPFIGNTIGLSPDYHVQQANPQHSKWLKNVKQAKWQLAESRHVSLLQKLGSTKGLSLQITMFSKPIPNTVND